MEMLLLALTVVAVIVAVIMGVTAWRLSREERARSGARVAALAAASSAGLQPRDLDAPVHVDTRSAELESRDEVALDSRIAGLEPRDIAVNESRPAPWAPARVSTIAAARPATRVEATPRVIEPAFSDGFLGSAVGNPPSGSRQRGLAVAAMILLVVAIGAGYWTVVGDRADAASAATAGTSAIASAPLELVSLRHERRGPRLEVTGLVRNPAAGAPGDAIAAVVFFFDQTGGFLSSARADIDVKKLAPGDESPFVVSLDAPQNVARYRVSFRTEAGVVPHVDQRQVGRVGQVGQVGRAGAGQ